MSYLIGIICALVFVIYIMIVHFRFPNKQINFIDRALSILLIVIFLMRFMCFKDAQIYGDTDYFINITQVKDGLINPALGIISNFLIWFEITCLLFICMRPFYHFRLIKYLVKFVSLPIMVLCLCFMDQILIMSQGFGFFNNEGGITWLSILYPIEIGLSIALSIYYWIKGIYPNKHNNFTILALNSSLSVKSKFLPKNYNLTSLECTSNNENIVSFIKCKTKLLVS